jgi:hypothetical protein
LRDDDVSLLVSVHQNIENATRSRYAAINTMLLPFLRYGHLASLATSFCRWHVKTVVTKKEEAVKRSMHATQIFMRNAGAALLQAHKFAIRMLQHIATRQLKPVFDKWCRSTKKTTTISDESMRTLEARILAKHGIQILSSKPSPSMRQTGQSRCGRHRPIEISSATSAEETQAAEERTRADIAKEAERTRAELELAVERLAGLPHARKISELLGGA